MGPTERKGGGPCEMANLTGLNSAIPAFFNSATGCVTIRYFSKNFANSFATGGLPSARYKNMT